jgi:hypothetical protein
MDGIVSFICCSPVFTRQGFTRFGGHNQTDNTKDPVKPGEGLRGLLKWDLRPEMLPTPELLCAPATPDTPDTPSRGVRGGAPPVELGINFHLVR